MASIARQNKYNLLNPSPSVQTLKVSNVWPQRVPRVLGEGSKLFLSSLAFTKKN
jgi:hypothetical protein